MAMAGSWNRVIFKVPCHSNLPMTLWMAVKEPHLKTVISQQWHFISFLTWSAQCCSSGKKFHSLLAHQLTALYKSFPLIMISSWFRNLKIWLLTIFLLYICIWLFLHMTIFLLYSSINWGLNKCQPSHCSARRRVGIGRSFRIPIQFDPMVPVAVAMF